MPDINQPAPVTRVWPTRPSEKPEERNRRPSPRKKGEKRKEKRAPDDSDRTGIDEYA